MRRLLRLLLASLAAGSAGPAQAQLTLGADTGRSVTLPEVAIRPGRLQSIRIGRANRPDGRLHLGPRWLVALRVPAQPAGSALRALRVFVHGDEGHPDAPLRFWIWAATPGDSLPGEVLYTSDTLWPAPRGGWLTHVLPLNHWTLATRDLWVGYQQLGTGPRWRYEFTYTIDGLPAVAESEGAVLGLGALQPAGLTVAYRNGTRWTPYAPGTAGPPGRHSLQLEYRVPARPQRR